MEPDQPNSLSEQIRHRAEAVLSGLEAKAVDLESALSAHRPQWDEGKAALKQAIDATRRLAETISAGAAADEET